MASTLRRPTFFSQAIIPTPLRTRSIQRTLIRHQPLTTTTTTNTSSSPSTLESPPPSSLSQSSTSTTITSSSSQSTDQPPTFEPLTYHVHRTPGQQLPIYHLAKAGGNKHQTRIRKISGRVEDLRDDLKTALGLGEKEIAINNVNRHIVIKGWKKFEVARFLEEKRF